MKLGFVIDKYFAFGGLQRDFLAIVEAAVARGDTVHAFVLSWEGDIPSGVTVHTCQTCALSNHARLKSLGKVATTQSVALKLDLLVAFKKIPGLDVYFMGEGLVSNKLMRKPWLRLLPRYRVYAQMESAVFSRGGRTQILYIDDAAKADALTIFDTESHRFKPVSPGVERAPIACSERMDIRQRYREQLGFDEQQFLLLFVASNFELKGLFFIMQAVAKLPYQLQQRCHVLVAGKDNPTKFQQLAEQLKLQHQVSFLGPRDDVSELMVASDVLVHPAQKEPGGKVLLEALMNGLPVAATDCCGYAKYIHEAKSGEIFPVERVETLSDILLTMLNIDSLKRYQQNANDYVVQHSFNQFPQQFLRYLDEVKS